MVGATSDELASMKVCFEQQQVPALFRAYLFPFTWQKRNAFVPRSLTAWKVAFCLLAMADAAVHRAWVEQRKGNHVVLPSALTNRIRSRALTCLCGQPTARKTSGGAQVNVFTPCGYSAGMKIVSPVSAR